jgi:Tfp pilus assembly protein PilO
MAIYLPLNKSIAAATRKLAESEKRLNLAGDVERLRNQFHQVEKRLPKQASADDWVQYVLAAIRRSPLKLDSFSPSVTRPLGPYQTVFLSIRLSGSLNDLDGFLHWLESNERLFRVENVVLTPKSLDGKDEMSMEISVLGVMG